MLRADLSRGFSVSAYTSQLGSIKLGCEMRCTGNVGQTANERTAGGGLLRWAALSGDLELDHLGGPSGHLVIEAEAVLSTRLGSNRLHELLALGEEMELAVQDSTEGINDPELDVEQATASHNEFEGEVLARTLRLVLEAFGSARLDLHRHSMCHLDGEQRHGQDQEQTGR